MDYFFNVCLFSFVLRVPSLNVMFFIRSTWGFFSLFFFS